MLIQGNNKISIKGGWIFQKFRVVVRLSINTPTWNYLLKRFHLTGHTRKFSPQTQKLELHSFQIKTKEIYLAKTPPETIHFSTPWVSFVNKQGRISKSNEFAKTVYGFFAVCVSANCLLKRRVSQAISLFEQYIIHVHVTNNVHQIIKHCYVCIISKGKEDLWKWQSCGDDLSTLFLGQNILCTS